MYGSRNKTDLIIEVWESLDCESIGKAELVAIENAVRERFGPSAVDSPMIVARLLADEGAELRHHEILGLYVDRNAETIHDAELRNILDIDNFESVARSIERMENLRRKYVSDIDRDGQRLLREKAITFKNDAHKRSLEEKLSPERRLIYAEIAEWLTIWLQTPEVFDNWLRLRLRSPEFGNMFGPKNDE